MSRDWLRQPIVGELGGVLRRNKLAVVLMGILWVASCKSQNGDYGAHTDSAAGIGVDYMAFAISRWESSTRMSVEPEAAAAVEQQVMEWNNRLSPETSARVATAYLYELRDVKQPTHGEAGVLQTRDVRRLPFAEFAADITAPDMAFLTCVSVPAGAAISIDGRRRGQTVKQFVVSASHRHRVVIHVPAQPCTTEVRLTKDEHRVVRCPG